jgi:hypothetical protein
LMLRVRRTEVNLRKAAQLARKIFTLFENFGSPGSCNQNREDETGSSDDSSSDEVLLLRRKSTENVHSVNSFSIQDS